MKQWLHRTVSFLLALILSVTPVLAAGPEDGGISGSELAQVYITVTSDLCTGSTLTKEIGYVTCSIQVVDPNNSKNNFTDAGSQIKVRGNSTAGGAKKPYNFKLSGKTNVLGMGKGKKWCLLANFFDKTLIRNKLAFQLAQALGMNFVPDFRMVDVWMDGTYVGNYMLCEPVEAKENRVDIDTANGDFIFERERERWEEGATYIVTSRWNERFVMADPEEDITEEMLAYYQSMLDKAETAMATNDIEEMAKVIDIQSFVDMYIILEFFKNVDVNWSSVKFYFQNGILYAGPVWDFDLSCGNANPANYPDYNNVGGSGDSSEGYYAATAFWFFRMLRNEDFSELVKQRYTELQPLIVNLYQDNELGTNQIDQTLKDCEASFDANWTVWDQGKTESTLERTADATFEANVEYLRSWMKKRNAWMNASIYEEGPIVKTVDYANLPDGVYTIANSANPYFCLDVNGPSTSNGANIHIWSKHLGDSQRWIFWKQSDGTYTIQNVYSLKVLDVNNSTNADGTNVQQYTSNNSSAQRWRIVDNGDGTCTIISSIGSRALDMNGGGSPVNGTNIQIWTQNNTSAQKWILSPVGLLKDDSYVIESAQRSGATLDLDANRIEQDGCNLQVWDYTGANNQKFGLIRGEDGYYTIHSLASGKLLDVANGSTSKGANIQQYTANGTDAQKWLPVATTSGYMFISKLNKLAMAINASSADNGTNVYCWTMNRSNLELWNVSVLTDGTIDMWTCPHTHCSQQVVSAATCLEEGKATLTCDRCGKATEETIPALGHDYQVRSETAATCEQGGQRTLACDRCGDEQTELLPATGHSYQQTHEEGDCDTAPGTRYTCENCGDSYYIPDNCEWSEWVEEIPEEYQDQPAISRTVYRYSDKQTVTSTDSDLEGYTQTGSEWKCVNSGEVAYVESWPSGFDQSHDLYSQYHCTVPTAYETETNKTTVSTPATTGYIYWHWCMNSAPAGGPFNRFISAKGGGLYVACHAFFSTVEPGTLETSNGAYKFSNSSCCTDTYWYYALPVMAVSYADYQMTYTYEAWTEWSEWSETVVEASETRRVESRVEYSYAINVPDGTHAWDKGTVTMDPDCTVGGVIVYTCTRCHATREETVPGKSHTVAFDPAVHATCTQPGLTQGAHCLICKAVIIPQEEIPAMGHRETEDAAVAPTCTEDGKTAGSHCATCGEVIVAQESIPATGHTWDEGTVTVPPTYTSEGVETFTCLICTQTRTEILPMLTHSELSIKQASLSLESAITMNFYVLDSVLEGWENPCMVFTKEIYDAEGNVIDTVSETVSEHHSAVTAKGESAQVFSLTGITSVEMCSKVTATVHATKDGEEGCGSTVTYSVLTYITNQLKNTDIDKKFADVLVDMVRYGAAAQQYWSYNVNNLPTRILNEELEAYGQQQAPVYSSVRELVPNPEATVSFKSVSLSLEDKVAINYYLNVTEDAGDIRDLKLVASYGDQEVEIDGSEFVRYTNQGATYYVVKLTALTAAEMQETVTVRVYSKTTGACVSPALVYSIASYAYSKQTDSLIKPLLDAMLNYGISAKAYFG